MPFFMETHQELYSLFEKSTGVFTDTRKPLPNGLFFALSGPHFDGNQFAIKALEQGALAAVVSDHKLKNNPHCIEVDNVEKALQNLANQHRKKFKGPVIGLTGSNGKTTTKELMYSVLKLGGNAYATQGNLNNHIGVPLTLLSMPTDGDFYIVEMGANHLGEIAQLCSISEPDLGYITNFGAAHLEGFGSLEGVVKGKSELYQYLMTNHKKILHNADDETQNALLSEYDSYSFGKNPNCNLIIDYHTKENELHVQWKGNTAVSRLYGSYNLTNIGAAIALGNFFNLKAETIKKGIEDYLPNNNRSQVVATQKNTLVLDAYNANPNSMRAALSAFDTNYKKHKVVILGAMMELGSYSDAAHQQIVDLLATMNLETVCLIGKPFKKTQNHPANTFLFEDTATFANWISNHPLIQKNILLKGSRAMALEKLQPSL